MRFDPIVSREKQSLEAELNSLEKEQRNLEAACWTDLSRLNLMLNEAILEYTAAKEKEKFLI